MQMTTLRKLQAAVILGAAVLSSCLPPGGAGQQSQTPKTEPGKPTPEALKAFNKTMEMNLKQCEDKTAEMDKKLTEALDKLKSKPGQSMSEIVAKLKEQKVTVTLQVLGSPEMPTLMLKDSLMEEGQKLAGQPPAKMQAFAKRSAAAQPLLTVLRDQVMGINGAIGAGFGSAISCSGYAKGFSTTLGALENGGNEPTPEIFDTFAKFLQANEQSKAAVAGSVALLSVMQAALAGKDTKAIDMLIDGIRDAQKNPEKITTEVAKKTYKAAGQALVDACREQQEKVYKEHPEIKRPAVDPCSKEGSRVRGSPSEEKARAEAAGQGGGEGTDEAIKRLVPKDSPLSDVTDALAAVQKGDVLGALKGVAGLVGRATPLGGVFKSVLSLFG
ncbi:MAG: hypothetical protein HY898_11205 [Deltaproteobacteria bacterium]|nr:hypothetical protein [Deltaproteobacteria bacterium]